MLTFTLDYRRIGLLLAGLQEMIQTLEENINYVNCVTDNGEELDQYLKMVTFLEDYNELRTELSTALTNAGIQTREPRPFYFYVCGNHGKELLFPITIMAISREVAAGLFRQRYPLYTVLRIAESK